MVKNYSSIIGTDLLIVVTLSVRLTIVRDYKLIDDIVTTCTLESKSFFNFNSLSLVFPSIYFMIITYLVRYQVSMIIRM